MKRDLARIAKADRMLATSSLAAAALEMAKQLDSPGTSATSKSMCAARLQELMERLAELAPKEQEKDGLDELGARRAARLAGKPAAQG